MLSKTAKQKNAYDAPALRKGVRLLELLCEAPKPLSIAQISQYLELNKHMVLRLLGTLCDEGWVVQEEGPVYRAGLMPLYHFSKPVNRMDAVSAAEEPIHDLWDLTGETTYMAIRDGYRSMGVSIRQTRRDVQVAGRVGARLHLHACAPGKVLLAHAEPAVFDHLAQEGFARHTDTTVCDPAELRKHLDQIVQQGYATDNEEYLRGMICLAGPVFDYTGRAVASVGVTTLTMFHTHESMLDTYTDPVLEACRRISRTLGYVESSGSHATPPVPFGLPFSNAPQRAEHKEHLP
ncbi:MAG: IclR family transcriptional regulator [Patescibacteria group bacterium]|nr:IclR family transcriptional regulator [Patescibacteria group bacterium]